MSEIGFSNSGVVVGMAMTEAPSLALRASAFATVLHDVGGDIPAHLHHVVYPPVRTYYTNDPISDIHVTTPQDADRLAKPGNDWYGWRNKATPILGVLLPILVLLLPGDPISKGTALSDLITPPVDTYVKEKQAMRERELDYWTSDRI